MTKITIDDVIESLRAQKIPAETVTKVVKDLEQAALEAKEEKASDGPKAKNQFIVLVADHEGKLIGTDLVAWVAQIEESASPAVALDRIKAAATAFNQSKRGRKHPAQTVGEVFESVPRKWFKTDREEEKFLIKTKEPVLVLRTDGKL